MHERAPASDSDPKVAHSAQTRGMLRRGLQVRARIGQWHMRRDNLATREWDGVIKAVAVWKPEHVKIGKCSREAVGTIRSILVEGVASTRMSEVCHRCGQAITNPISRLLGYGPICSDMLGIPRPEVLTPEAAERERVRITRDVRREIWCTVAYTEITVLGEATPAEPPVARPEWDVKFLLDAEHNEIVVLTFPEFRLRVRSVSGWAWNSRKDNTWRFRQSPSTAVQLKAAFDGCKRRATPDFMQLLASAEQAATNQALKVAVDLPPLEGVAVEGWLHQRRAFWFARDLPAVGLFMDMGTGKTLVALSLIRARGVTKTLVLAPKKVLASDRTWSKNARKFCPDLAVFEALPQPGWTLLDRVQGVSQRIATRRPADAPYVVVMNYEALDSDEVVHWIEKHRFDLIVLDESHKIKGTDAKRARVAWKLGAHAKQRLCLTGTPMPHSPLDVWSQYKFLDPGVFGTRLGAFRARYCELGGWQGKEVLGWQHQDELHAKIYQIGYRVGKEVLDLPPERDEQLLVQLCPNARRLAEALQTEMVAMIGQLGFEYEAYRVGAAVLGMDGHDNNEEVTNGEGKGRTTVTNVLVKLLRQQQITSGFLPDDAGTLQRVDTAKQEALEELLDTLQPPVETRNPAGAKGFVAGEPVVVFCRFRHDLDVVRMACERSAKATGHDPFRYAELSGRRDDLAMWQEGGADVLGVQIQAGGAGIDLTRACYAVYYSVGYSLGDYQQSRARVHRPGQTRATTYYHLVAQGTIDETVYEALAARKNVVDMILEREREMVQA